MSGLRDSGFLSALVPDDSGGLTEWATKYARIVDETTPNAALLLFTDQNSKDPEARVLLHGAKIRIQANDFTVTTSDALSVHLRGSTFEDADWWVYSLKAAMPFKHIKTRIVRERGDLVPEPEATNDASTSESVCTTGPAFVYDDGRQGWIEVFAVVSSGRVLLYAHPSDQTPQRVVSLDPRTTSLALVRLPPREQIEVRGEKNVLRVLGETTDATLALLDAMRARSAEAIALDAAPTVDALAADAALYLRRRANLSMYDLKRTKSLNSQSESLAWYAMGAPNATKRLVAGQRSTFHLLCAHPNPASLNADASDFAVRLTSALDPDVALAVGTVVALEGDACAFAVTIAQPRAKKYTLRVDFRRRPIFGSPFKFVVEPSVVSAQHSSITGSGALGCVVGRENVFRVELCDAYGNAASSVDAQTQSDLPISVAALGSSYTLASITDNKNGTYDVSYGVSPNALAQGQIQVSLRSSNAQIRGSPLIPTVHSDASFLRAEKSIASRLDAQNASSFAWMNSESSSYVDSFDAQAIVSNEAVKLNAAVLTEEERDDMLRASEEARVGLMSARAVAAKTRADGERLAASFVHDWAVGETTDDARNDVGILVSADAIRGSSSRRVLSSAQGGRSTLKAPAPWASLGEFEAYLYALKSVVVDALRPVAEALRRETAETGQSDLFARWKSQVLRVSSENVSNLSLEDVIALHVSLSESTLPHRDDLCALLVDVREAYRSVLLKRNDDVHASSTLLADSSSVLPIISTQQRSSSAASTSEIRKSFKRRMNLDSSETGENTIKDESLTENQPKLATGDSVVLNFGKRQGAVVRFVGTVDFAKGEWIGVELETPGGKNDGTVLGVRYFTCQRNFGSTTKLNYGLFVRPSQVSRKIVPDKSNALVGKKGNLGLKAFRERRAELRRMENKRSYDADGSRNDDVDDEKNAFGTTQAHPEALIHPFEQTTLNESFFAPPSTTMDDENDDASVDVERWLTMEAGIVDILERKNALKEVLKVCRDLEDVSRLESSVINRFAVGFDARMKILSGSRALRRKYVFRGSPSKSSPSKPSEGEFTYGGGRDSFGTSTGTKVFSPMPSRAPPKTPSA